MMAPSHLKHSLAQETMHMTNDPSSLTEIKDKAGALACFICQAVSLQASSNVSAASGGRKDRSSITFGVATLLLLLRVGKMAVAADMRAAAKRASCWNFIVTF